MNKLNKLQKKAYKEFEKTGRVFIDAPRRSGKTTLLQYIVEQNPDKSIGVFSSYGQRFVQLLYGKYKNCKYNNFYAEILIGDEAMITGFDRVDHKIACAFTGCPRITKWTDPYNKQKLEYIKKFEREMSKEHYQKEFGNYLTK